MRGMILNTGELTNYAPPNTDSIMLEQEEARTVAVHYLLFKTGLVHGLMPRDNAILLRIAVADATVSR